MERRFTEANLNLDWVAREAALPEAGVGPQAELHDYPCGTFDWLDKTLKEMKALPNSDDIRIFIMQHHPFRNRDIADPFGKNLLFNFTFDDKQDAQIQNLIGKYFPPSSILGSQAGHMHIWLSEPGFSPYTAISNVRTFCCVIFVVAFVIVVFTI